MPDESTVTLAAVSSGFGSNMITSFISGPSAGAFTMLNTIQLLLLLPLVPKYMPQKIIDFMYGISICLGTFQFIKFGSITVISQILDWFSIAQGNSYLGVIGLDSESSFVNTYSSLGFMMIIPFLHLSIWMLK